MGLSDAYVQGSGKIAEFFGKIRDGQAPTQFTQQLLKDWGYTSTNDRLFIPLLKDLGFLSPDGHPTTRYHDYRDHSRSKSVMGQAIHEAYEDIFLIKAKPTRDDKDLISGKFKSFHNVADRPAQMMTNTFLALLEIAELTDSHSTKHKEEKSQKIEKNEPMTEALPMQATVVRTPDLYYNIQIHLPATKDIEVYNSIFKSLKEHLFSK